MFYIHVFGCFSDDETKHYFKQTEEPGYFINHTFECILLS